MNTEEAAQRLNVGSLDREKPDGRERKRDSERGLFFDLSSCGVSLGWVIVILFTNDYAGRQMFSSKK